MAERQSWPAWRYGPNGEAQIFASAGDVPEGWVKHPSKHPPAPEQLPERSGGEVHALQLKVKEVTELLARKEVELSDFTRQRDEAVETLRAENARLRAENTRLQEKASLVPPLPQREQMETPTVRRPRKLNAPGTPFTPQDETITVDEGRTERLKVLREAGITISDDATDGDIEEALDWLEKQPKKG